MKEATFEKLKKSNETNPKFSRNASGKNANTSIENEM